MYTKLAFRFKNRESLRVEFIPYQFPNDIALGQTAHLGGDDHRPRLDDIRRIFQ